jgi:predicted Zn-dependent protease
LESTLPAESEDTALDRHDVETLGRRALALTRAEAARVTVRVDSRGFTRYAANRITTAGESVDTTVSITSVFGQRVATVTTNRLDDDGLEDAARRSEELARLAPANPESMPELEAQRYVAVRGEAPSRSAGAGGERGAAARAEGVAAALRVAQEAGAVAAGFVDTAASTTAIVNTRGLFAEHTSTGAAHTTTMRTQDGDASGWAGAEASAPERVDGAALARTAVEKCLAGRTRRELDPGRYTAILEPTAAGMLLLRLLDHLDARAADEGRSFFSKPGGGNRIGEALFDARVTIESDPAIAGAEAAPFDAEGLPRRAVRWIDRGVVRELQRSRYWARERGGEPIAAPGNLVFSAASGEGLDDLVASTERGVLITRFWYIRALNPRTMSYTGLTRDGTFLVEDGRIAAAVSNFRFNQSLADLLREVEAVGASRRVVATEASSLGMPLVAPALKVRAFHLSSRSDAV